MMILSIDLSLYAYLLCVFFRSHFALPYPYSYYPFRITLLLSVLSACIFVSSVVRTIEVT